MADDLDAVRAPRGTRDVLPPESWRWQGLTRLAQDSFGLAGYAPLETPVFEHTEIFERGVGQASELVGKQMYTFLDRAGRSLTLRPEGTAPVVRAVLERGLHRGPLPVKLAYAGPMFRQERPQKGRHRQFFQVGIEAVGGDSPALDAEVIEIGKRFLEASGVEATLLINSIGHVDPSCRQGYLKVLVEFLAANERDLAPEDRERLGTNPLRAFDSKEPKTIETLKRAPVISDYLCDSCQKHFESVTTLLRELEVDFELEPRLVRGLDYYTRTAFEYLARGLGAQNAVGGGGRYDGLSEALGGPRLPGVGFALGLDRIVLARADSPPTRTPIRVYAVALGEESRSVALKLVTRLRASGIGADLDLAGRSMKGQLREAARSGARFALILGDKEIASGAATLRNLSSGGQESVVFEELIVRLRGEPDVAQ